MANSKQAQDLISAESNLGYEALKGEDFEYFFVSTQVEIPGEDPIDVRNGDLIFKELERSLKKNPLGNQKYLISGPKGCGKSTELNRLQRVLGDDFLSVSFSVKEFLDMLNFSSTELLMVVLRRLFEEANQKGLEVAEDFIAPIKKWADDIQRLEEWKGNYGLEAEAGVRTGISFAGIGKLFASLNSRAKYDRTFTEVVRKSGEILISDLIENANTLLLEVKMAIENKGMKGLLIVVEDMDKLDPKQGRKLFMEEASRLTALNANFIYTYPLNVRYHPNFTNVAEQFASVYELPLIKTHTRNGERFEPGFQVLRTILEKRMNLNLLEEGVLDQLIHYSGGHLADLFRLAKDACNNALNFDRTRVNGNDFDRAKKRNIETYRSVLGDWVENNTVIIAASDFYKALFEVYRSPSKAPKNSRLELELRNNHCILFYNNGENWIDVHPLVEDLIKNSDRFHETA